MKKNPFVYYGKKALVFLLSVFILSVAVFYISRLAPGHFVLRKENAK